MAPSSGSRLSFAPGKSPFHAKGVTYRNVFQYVDETLEGGRARLLAAIDDPALRAFASQPFLAGSLYDVVPMLAIVEAAAGLLGKPFSQVVREFSKQAA